MGTFIAAAIIPAYHEMSLDIDASIQRTSYLTSLQIAILGGAPLLWKPLSQRFGRRPVFLLSLLLGCVCNIGCAKSPDYASMAACRALASFFISPAMAIGSAVVMETFFKKERAAYMGIWTVMVTLGVPIGPFIFGFVAYRVGYEWIYWVLAIVSCSLNHSALTILINYRQTTVNSFSISSSARKLATFPPTPSLAKLPSKESTSTSAALIHHHLPYPNLSILYPSSLISRSLLQLSHTQWFSSSPASSAPSRCRSSCRANSS